ncbi:related to acetyl-CoA transporter [Saccharomycodes ludwigii]|uniref:Related to acetyl-CoA transporter n=1 Tax=Saccharomycodes ludwigii TaxID=36035 RepID=A0A376B7T0_9ASCO|nr:hypothetical protein SCDLUD_000989 [Saccharomycodes ludwigii]KAH3903360.1 hypothetical protein SCDLUD_000989 [Saccharomycodes ludwigii]SSD60747.1 related to acetyl-CoA transporter [Saccharomycodes ludwigii]
MAHSSSCSSTSLAKCDRPQFVLLIVLYLLQGIPTGLAFGTMPFLLKTITKSTTFTQIGIFSMATYPYSAKILWSPIVDSKYLTKVGRRRSWIIPIQFLIGISLLILGSGGLIEKLFPGVDSNSNAMLGDINSNKSVNIHGLTIIFFSLIFLCATQDIAVDGWALEILSPQSLSYASTAQTIGLNIGYFMSFTLFLSLNSSDFVNKYFRSTPLEYGFISLTGYFKFVGWLYILVTLYVIFKTKENQLAVEQSSHILPISRKKLDEVEHIELNAVNAMVLAPENDNMINDIILPSSENSLSQQHSLTNVYESFKHIIKLKNVQTLVIIHLVCKFAFQCNDSATQLKLLERGLKREDLAITVLFNFPFELIFGYYVAKWSIVRDSGLNSSNYPYGNASINKRNKLFYKLMQVSCGERGSLTPWLIGYLGRILAALMGNFVVWSFPTASTNDTTAIIIPKKYFVLVIAHNLFGSFMNTIQFVCICAFHTRIADPLIGGTYMTLLNTLSNLGGTWPKFFIMNMIDKFTVKSCEKRDEPCYIVRDGYYVTNLFCVMFGVLIYFGFIKKNANYLQKLPISSWRRSNTM